MTFNRICKLYTAASLSPPVVFTIFELMAYWQYFQTWLYFHFTF